MFHHIYMYDMLKPYIFDTSSSGNKLGDRMPGVSIHAVENFESNHIVGIYITLPLLDTLQKMTAS